MTKSITFYLNKIVEIFNFYIYLRFKKVNHNENIFIYGFSRGGTTLAAEALSNTMNCRLLWEPLFPHRDVRLRKINPYSTFKLKELQIGWNSFFSDKERLIENKYFDSLFSLKERNIRLLRYTNHKKFGSQKKSIFKFCFANFMYPYFNKRYNNKSIILLRHPFAIASSSLKFGSNYDYHKKNYKKWFYEANQQSDDFFKQYDGKYHLISSAFTLLVFQAVSQFSFILNQIDRKNTIVIYYEELISDPENVRKHLSSHFNHEINSDEFEKSIKKQSFSSNINHTSKDIAKQLSKWVENIPEAEIEMGMKIFNAFDFKEYGNEILPLKNEK